MDDALATFAALILVVFGWVPGTSGEQPNIVFFFADDQTTSTLGCCGNEVIQTPNIGALARSGMRFENAFVSHSICWVSRTTILTGLTGRGYGEPGNRDKARADAVATLSSDLLRDHGYRTGYFGKWHAKMPKGYRKEDHFDEFEAIGRNPYYKQQPDGSLRHETELIVDRGIEFLKSQPQGKPFALNMWFNSGHAADSDRRPGIGHFPWPRAVDGMYDDVEIAAPHLNDPATFEALPDFLKTTINRERYFWRWNTDQKYQTNIRFYYRMIIVDTRAADNQKGTTADAIALNLDLPATFLDWAGVRIPERYQGHSLLPIVSSEKPDDWRTESLHEHFAVRNRIPAFEGLRNEQYKYVRYVDEDGYEFLRDLKNDPDELINLAGDPAHAETLKAMRKRTTERVKEIGGPLLPIPRPIARSTLLREMTAGTAVPHLSHACKIAVDEFQSTLSVTRNNRFKPPELAVAISMTPSPSISATATP